ncbi:MAG: class I SAM-dependent methyltransferase [Chloroflexota bacterium]
MTTDPKTIFLDIYNDLPRQGPGSPQATERALSHVPTLADDATIADIGCGPGMQTMNLAEHTSAHIIGVDFHTQYLAQLNERITANGLQNRISTIQADMNHLPFSASSLDLIWSEGAVYIMGVTNALTTWKPFLKPASTIAFTEIAWIRDNPPQTIYDYWTENYAKMASTEEKIAEIHEAGYDVSVHFTLSADEWWTHYYAPLEARLPAMSEKYADNPLGQSIIAETRRELTMHREYGDYYSYVFFVCRSHA